MCLDGELGAADTVVFLGDYIDRGPDSKGCIDRILRFRAESRASVVALLGNHEHSSIGIDTISHGILTAFRLPDRRVFQSARFT